MLGLIMKDFLIQKRWVYFSPLIALPLWFGYGWVPIVPLGMSWMVIWSILTSTAFQQDEKNTGEPLLNSLPLTRREIVIGRYLASLAFFIYAGLLSLAFYGFLKLVGLIPDWNMHWNLLIPGLLILAGLTMSCFLPLFFKLGSQRTQWIFMAMFLGYVGIIPLIKSNRFDLVTALPNPPDVLTIGLAVLGLAAMIGLSILISVRFYRSREF